MKKPVTEKDFTEALNRISATNDGQVVLACLKEFVNFDGDITAGTPQDTYANAAIRRAYLYLRNRIDPKYLKEIEFNYVRKAESHDRAARATKPSDTPARTRRVRSTGSV
jgi:hypothetical protein